jgi:hypothetical protein
MLHTGGATEKWLRFFRCPVLDPVLESILLQDLSMKVSFTAAQIHPQLSIVKIALKGYISANQLFTKEPFFAPFRYPPEFSQSLQPIDSINKNRFTTIMVQFVLE